MRTVLIKKIKRWKMLGTTLSDGTWLWNCKQTFTVYISWFWHKYQLHFSCIFITLCSLTCLFPLLAQISVHRFQMAQQNPSSLARLNCLNPQSSYPKFRHHVTEYTMNKLHGDCVKLLITNKTYFTQSPGAMSTPEHRMTVSTDTARLVSFYVTGTYAQTGLSEACSHQQTTCMTHVV